MKNRFNRYWQIGAMVVVAGCMLAGPGMVRADDATGTQKTDKPVLAGPKADAHAKGQNKRFNGENQHRDLMREVLNSLNLTDDQKDQVKTIVVDSRTQRKAWQNDHQDELKSLCEDMKSAREAKDKEKLTVTAKKLKDLMADAPKPKDTLDKIRAILTPEQQTAFDAKLKELREQARSDGGGMMQGKHADKNAKGKKAARTGDTSKPGDTTKPDDTQNTNTQDGKLDL